MISVRTRKQKFTHNFKNKSKYWHSKNKILKFRYKNKLWN